MAFKSKVNDEDFYSAMAADFDEDSEVSEADVSKMLADMDDMDDDLFASSLKPRKGSSRASSRAAKDSDASSKDSRPASKMSTAASPPGRNIPEAPDSGITDENKDLKSSKKSILDTSPVSSPRRPKTAKTKSKAFDFGDFDEDDPLAGLLSDDEDEKPKKKAPPQKKPPPRTQEKQPSLEEETKTSASDNKEDAKPQAKDKPSPDSGRRSNLRKKADDIDFDDDDILGTMGFDEETPRVEKKKADPDAKERQAAQAKVNDLFGRKPSISSEKPPAGRKREFVLDKKYVKAEPKKEEPKEEDFIFGAYTPSSVGGLGRPESAPPPRRSVRFEDSDNDDMLGGTFSRPRSRARMKPTLDEPPKRPHSSADTRRKTSDAEPSKPKDDWLELALGSDAKKEKKTVLKEKDAKGGEGEEKESSPVKQERPPSSAADYLGLAGDDIDPDSIVSKPTNSRGQSSTAAPKGQDLFTAPAKRDTTSPFPWDSSKKSPTKHRPSGQAEADQPDEIQGMLGNDFDDEEEEQPLQTRLMAQQLAQIQKIQQPPASKQEIQSQPSPSQPTQQQQPVSNTQIAQPHELGLKQKTHLSTTPQTGKKS